MDDIEVHRVDFGYFVRPGTETESGVARAEPVLGYLVRHPDGVLLLDTGMGSEPGVDAHYRPRRRDVHTALADVGQRVDAVSLVTNCHLHFDHCGGNPQFGHVPILVQRTELAEATSTPDYTLPELVEGTQHEQLDGEAEVWPGVFVLPTPGHTRGHQSVVVRRRDGVVILAGQSHDTATAFGSDALAHRADADGHAIDLPATSPWLERLLQLDPRQVYFAHDRSVWTP